MTKAETLLPEFDHEMAGTRVTLARVPADRFDFKPHPRSFSLGQLANHLAAVPSWATTTFTTTELDFIDPATAARMPLPATTAQGLVDTLDQGVKAARAALAAASDADLIVVWTGRKQGEVLFAFPGSRSTAASS